MTTLLEDILAIEDELNIVINDTVHGTMWKQSCGVQINDRLEKARYEVEKAIKAGRHCGLEKKQLRETTYKLLTELFEIDLSEKEKK